MSTPLQEKCAFCKKNKVTSHHRLCDSCWGKRAKDESRKEKRKLLLPIIKKYSPEKLNNVKRGKRD